jgi:hypothetical protein
MMASLPVEKRHSGKGKGMATNFLMIFVLVVAIGSVGVPQGKSAKMASSKQDKTKPEEKPKRAPVPCPSEQAADACVSFFELYRAKDRAVLPVPGDTAYACFREEKDEFFVIEFSNPEFIPQLDTKTRLRVFPKDASNDGYGSVTAFSKGIEDSTVHPIGSFQGKWKHPSFPRFTSDAPDDGKEREQTPSILIDSSQFEASHRFKNRFDKPVDYHLVMQLSTGRFSETFTEDKEKFPFVAQTGRCLKYPIKLPALKDSAK